MNDNPASSWNPDDVKTALDELFNLSSKYRTSAEYGELLKFVAKFHRYSFFNATLIHVQMPGARFVATPLRWRWKYRRWVKAEARPIVILQPMGPVRFLFDVSDTEPMKHAKPLPRAVTRPFAVRKGNAKDRLKRVVENSERDGVRVKWRREGSQSGGSIRVTWAGTTIKVLRKGKNEPEDVRIPIRYDILVNETLDQEARYATVVHELAHLYCGHLGTINPKWWPDRRGMGNSVCELEAESVSYLVCKRAGIDTPSETYLADYFKRNPTVEEISLDRVMASAKLIEKMSWKPIPLRELADDQTIPHSADSKKPRLEPKPGSRHQRQHDANARSVPEPAVGPAVNRNIPRSRNEHAGGRPRPAETAEISDAAS